MTSESRTERFDRICELIVESRQQRGISPSYRELADRTGMALATIQDDIRIMREQGLVTQIEGVPRSIQVVNPKEAAS